MAVSEKLLIRVQAISGLLFATFLILHLSNLMASILGQNTYDLYMRTLRWYYQNPLVEIFVVGTASLTHIFASLTRGIKRRKKERSQGQYNRPSLRLRLHRYSGYFIFLAFFGHVLATRSPSLIFAKNVDMSFLHFSLTIMPWFFYPYYILLGTSGIYHLSNGVISALRLLKVKIPKSAAAPSSRMFWIWAGLSLAITIFSVLSIGGILIEIDSGRYEEWKLFASKFLPISLLE